MIFYDIALTHQGEGVGGQLMERLKELVANWHCMIRQLLTHPDYRALDFFAARISGRVPCLELAGKDG
jgi:predicted N-acetyltransferase YhbS